MIQKGRYRHFKGNLYEVIGVAKHSETLEDMVIYRSMVDPEKLWVRPAAMWEETVSRDGYVGPRFVYLSTAEGEENQ